MRRSHGTATVCVMWCAGHVYRPGFLVKGNDFKRCMMRLDEVCVLHSSACLNLWLPGVCIQPSQQTVHWLLLRGHLPQCMIRAPTLTLWHTVCRLNQTHRPRRCVGACCACTQTQLGRSRLSLCCCYKVEMFFKTHKYCDGIEDGDGWHTFLKKGRDSLHLHACE